MVWYPEYDMLYQMEVLGWIFFLILSFCLLAPNFGRGF